MVNKPRAIEVVKNLKQTVSKMSDKEPVQSQSTVYEVYRPSKSKLLKKIKKLVDFYKLNSEDLK